MPDPAPHISDHDSTEPAVGIEALAAWIHDASAPCPETIEHALASDPALRGIVRDLRLGLLEPDTASVTLRNAVIGLGMPRPVLASIGRRSAAAAAAIAIALLGFQLGTAAAGPRAFLQGNELAAFGLDDTSSDEAWIALLLPEEDPS